MKWAFIIFVVSFLISTVLVAPYLKWKEQKEKNEELVKQRPRFSNNNSGIEFPPSVNQPGVVIDPIIALKFLNTGKHGATNLIGGMAVIGGKLIGSNRGPFAYVVLNQRLKGLLLSVRNHLCHNRPVALQHPENDRLVLNRAAFELRTLAASADVRLVNLNVTKERPFTVNVRHVLPDQIGHAPSGLVGHAKLPLQLLSGNTVAGSGEKVDGVKPQLQRRAAILEWRACRWVKVMAAGLTGIGALRFKPRPLHRLLAFWADVPLAKAALENVNEARFVIRKLTVELQNCEARFNFHALNNA